MGEYSVCHKKWFVEIEFDFGRGVMFDGGEIVPQRPINGLRCLEIFFAILIKTH